MNQAQRFTEPNEVDMFSLYSHLWNEASKMTNGEGVVEGAKLRFLEEQINAALIAQYVRSQDIEDARKHVTNAKWIKKHKDGYGVTSQGLADYHAKLRRV